MNISDIKNEVTINKLTKEKIELQEKISELNQELNITKKNLEQISSQKKELEEKINLYKIDIKTLITKKK